MVRNIGRDPGMKRRKIGSMNNGRLVLSLFLREHGIDNMMIIHQKRREMEASKITEQLEKKISRYEGYIDRLERKAGSQFQPEDEGTSLIILFLHFIFLF
jgi:SMC interacting uncharacterized protein involved in chromosome segregation